MDSSLELSLGCLRASSVVGENPTLCDFDEGSVSRPFPWDQPTPLKSEGFIHERDVRSWPRSTGCRPGRFRPGLALLGAIWSDQSSSSSSALQTCTGPRLVQIILQSSSSSSSSSSLKPPQPPCFLCLW